MISFRIEEVIINWLTKREKETGKNTSDFLRELVWSSYHQELHQKVSQNVAEKYYEEKLKYWEKEIKKAIQFFASNPESPKRVAQFLLNIEMTLEQSGLKPLFIGPRNVGGANRRKRVRKSKALTLTQTKS